MVKFIQANLLTSSKSKSIQNDPIYCGLVLVGAVDLIS